MNMATQARRNSAPSSRRGRLRDHAPIPPSFGPRWQVNPAASDQRLRPGRGEGASRRRDRLDGPGHHRGRALDKTLQGIVILQRSIRSWWKPALIERRRRRHAPPDCSSQDGIWGVGHRPGTPTGRYRGGVRPRREVRCRYGKRQRPITGALRLRGVPARTVRLRQGRARPGVPQNRLVFLLTPGLVAALVIKVPPSSLRAVQSFMLRLSGKASRCTAASCSLSPRKKAQNGQGIDYAEIVPSSSLDSR
jgi:hypothetical protein